MSGKKWAGFGLLAVLLGGYGTLDAYDVVPGVLTIDRGNEARTVSLAGQTYRPLQNPAKAPALPAPNVGAAPSPAAVRASVDTALKNSWFGQPTAVTVLDANTGRTLYEKNSNTSATPASVTKLLSAYAISHSRLLESQRLTTSAMVDGSTVQLVAGGDMTLAAGKGDPTRIAGHAGLEDLAAQTAAALKSRGLGKVTVKSNTAYAPGPSTAKGWTSDFLSMGFTARISTLALASDRADDKTPAAQDPTKNATDAYVAALKKQGIDATYGGNVTSAPTGTKVGSIDSAPVLDLLGLALQDSDNSMIESLSRQAAALDGVSGDSTRAGAWVVNKAKAQGIDVAGVHLSDTSGLSSGTTLPVRVLGQIVAKGASGQDVAFQRTLSRLPLAGWDGTVADRFSTDKTKNARGLVHAKTGSLPGVSSLAGEAVTKGNRRLVFAISTNGTFSQGPGGAKEAIDELVAGLTSLS